MNVLTVLMFAWMLATDGLELPALQSHTENRSCNCAEGDESSQRNKVASATNKMCPVMQDELAEDAWTTVYQGKLVRFCCNNCVDSFRRNPELFLDSLPQFSEQKTDRPAEYKVDKDKLRFLGLAIGGLLFCALGWHWHKRRITAGKIALVNPLLVQIAIAVAAAWIIQLTLANQRLHLEIFKQIAVHDVQHSTFFDYGFPPIPHRPDIAPALSAKFYRGNDERSPVLYNGGNYQTAVFEIALEHGDGRQVLPGDRLSQDSLRLKFSIRKTKNSPLRMFNDKIMNKIYLTKSYDPLMGWDEPIVDQTPIRNVKTGELWECRFPLDVAAPPSSREFDPSSVTASQLTQIEGIDSEVAKWFVSYRDAGFPVKGPDDLRQAGITGAPAQILTASLNRATFDGVVYVCEAFFHDDRQMGARIHYGIKYDIKIQNGVIQDDSEIWMGALSRSQKAAKGAIPDMQWLSSEPLPELPKPQHISDELLGIDDYDW